MERWRVELSSLTFSTGQEMRMRWQTHYQECVDPERPSRSNGVIVVIVGNGHGDTSSNPGRD